MPTDSSQSSSPATGKSSWGKYLTFSLGQESYGIPILKVREIIRVPDITPVPQMPDYVKGVINLRGKVIPVIDLRVKFQFPKAEFHDRTCMIIVSVKLSSGEPALIGLIVDVVEEVMNIQTQDIEDAPNFGAKLETDYILGLAKTKGAVKTILDIERIVASDSIETASVSAAAREKAAAPQPISR